MPNNSITSNPAIAPPPKTISSSRVQSYLQRVVAYTMQSSPQENPRTATRADDTRVESIKIIDDALEFLDG
jgi:hypothetical protein